jgi:CubicO group peptidase (beta-lactamase class C family)
MWETVDKIVKSGINKIYPGAVLLVGRPGEILYEKSYGTIDGVRKTQLDTIYDIASLTKVVATTTAVMKLFEEGLLHLNDRLGYFLPVEGKKADITIFQLLTHTSGMAPYTELWKHLKGKALLEEILKIQPVYEPGKIVYSCLNFITLMAVVEAVSGTSFDEFVYSILYPIGMNNTSFNPEKYENIAPTSIREGKRLIGEPDDELAYYLGGVSGNAGLFSSARDLFIFMSALLKGEIMRKKIVNLFSQHVVDSHGKRRHLGWEAPYNGSSAGDILLHLDHAFGHTGFTGTSIWCDGEKFVILLTNRVFIKRFSEGIGRIRILLHNVVFGGL